jgi:hypothetical protein
MVAEVRPVMVAPGGGFKAYRCLRSDPVGAVILSDRRGRADRGVAHGAASIGSGLSGGYMVTRALSKTSVALSSGGKSQVGNLVAAVVAVLCVIVLRSAFCVLRTARLGGRAEDPRLVRRTTRWSRSGSHTGRRLA